ncbi:MAG: hypothetical protein MZW92_56835 [Comamonadaceae bacterium]|nr:hypothetical protein [Comamonadaceae bacterium]
MNKSLVLASLVAADRPGRLRQEGRSVRHPPPPPAAAPAPAAGRSCRGRLRADRCSRSALPTPPRQPCAVPLSDRRNGRFGDAAAARSRIAADCRRAPSTK